MFAMIARSSLLTILVAYMLNFNKNYTNELGGQGMVAIFAIFYEKMTLEIVSLRQFFTKNVI